MELRINSTTKLSVLLALLRRPAHGYALMDAVQAGTGIRPGPAQIYPFLWLLQKKKFVKVSRKGARDKTVYELTASGRAFSEGFISKMGMLLEGALGSKVTECTHCKCKIYGRGFEKKIAGHDCSFCCPHCAENFQKKGKA
jgi:hypothetical protein